MAIEIVDLPIKNMVIVHNYVSLPNGYKPFEMGGLWHSKSTTLPSFIVDLSIIYGDFPSFFGKPQALPCPLVN